MSTPCTTLEISLQKIFFSLYVWRYIMILSSLLDYYSLLLIMWGFFLIHNLPSQISFLNKSDLDDTKSTTMLWQSAHAPAKVMISRHYVVIVFFCQERKTKHAKKPDCIACIWKWAFLFLSSETTSKSYNCPWNHYLSYL